MGRSILISGAKVSPRMPQHQIGYLFPYWVIYGEWGSPNVTRVPHGAIVITTTKAIVVKPLTVWHGNMGTTAQSAEAVCSVQDVRDYVTKAIGAALSLDHG
jgi:hypothetical protein